MSQKPRKKKLSTYLKELAFGAVMGLIIGLAISFIFALIGLDIEGLPLYAVILVFLAAICLSLPIHVTLHELGHVTLARLTGFRFAFISLFGLTWVNKKSGVQLRKNPNPFALGQAAMIPPANAGRGSYAFYLMGGVLFNSLFGLLMIWTGQMLPNIYLQSLTVMLGVLGLLIGLMNLWPYDQSDGQHLFKLLRRPKYAEEMGANLQATAILIDANSFDDVKELMTVDPHAPMTHLHNLTAVSLQASQAACQNDFYEASKLYRGLYEQKDELYHIQQFEIMLEYLFALLLSDPNHKHVYQIKKDKLVQQFWQNKRPLNYRVRAADAFYMRFDSVEANKHLMSGRALIDQQITDFDQVVERQLFNLLEERIASDDLEDLKLIPHEELLGHYHSETNSDTKTQGDDQHA